MQTQLAKINLDQNKFVQIFQAVHKYPAEQARNMFQVEAFSFTAILQEKPELLECTEISIKSVFLDVITNGLSFGATAKHVYLQPSSSKVRGDDGKEYWEKRLVFAPAPDGKVYMCQRAGSLERIQGPVIIYEGDKFQTGTDRNGNTWIEHMPGPRAANSKAIGGFCWQVFPSGQKNAVFMDQIEINRRAGYSAKRNKGAANALYTSYYGGVDPGFLGAKLIDAATKGLRKKEINSAYVVQAEEAGDEMPIHDEPTQPDNNVKSYF